MEFTPFTHGENNSTPTGDRHANILGLELEIGEVYDYTGLNDAFWDGVLEAADSSCAAPIQIEEEEDPNNELEIIFNADEKDIIMSRLREFNAYDHDFYTHAGSSAHVHLNRAFLADIGLTETDILKATEAIAPVIYDVSGRDAYYWERWSEEYVERRDAYALRFLKLDELTPLYGSRYYLTNFMNSKTVEIRGFSNYCNFNEMDISLFLGIASELIINIALDMQGRSYAADGLTVVTEQLENFFINKKENSWALRYYDLEKYLDVDFQMEELKRAKINKAVERYNKTKQHYLWDIRHYIRHNNRRSALHVISDCICARNFQISNINLNDLSETAEELELANLRQLLAALSE